MAGDFLVFMFVCSTARSVGKPLPQVRQDKMQSVREKMTMRHKAGRERQRLCTIVLCGILLCCVVLCYAVLYCVVLCCIMLCYVVLCCVVLCCTVLCCIVLCVASGSACIRTCAYAWLPRTADGTCFFRRGQRIRSTVPARARTQTRTSSCHPPPPLRALKRTVVRPAN